MASHKGTWETSPAAMIGRRVGKKGYDPKSAAQWQSAAGVSASDIESHYKKQAEAIEQSKTVGNTPMPTVGSRQPHGYGHSASQRDGALRLSGNPKAHRIGKR